MALKSIIIFLLLVCREYCIAILAIFRASLDITVALPHLYLLFRCLGGGALHWVLPCVLSPYYTPQIYLVTS